MTRIYTRRGDDGTTGLGGGQRVDKDSLRVHAYGTVDELNSAIGVALAHGVSERLGEPLRAIQNDLFHLGSDLCFIEADKARLELPQLSQARVDALEHLIDACNDATGPLENFILPGGSVGAAQLHVAHDLSSGGTRRDDALAERRHRRRGVAVPESTVRCAVRDGAIGESAARRGRTALEQPRLTLRALRRREHPVSEGAGLGKAPSPRALLSPKAGTRCFGAACS
ncbi:MAG: cob(I)yrinic acid a,c-diamide adenosyltransferase [Vicinamibacterales bacterium]